MNIVILAGGRGTRMSALSQKPKCILEINGKPILVHLINHFKKFGFRRFIIALGHRSDEVTAELEKHNLGVELLFTEPSNEGTAFALKSLEKYFDSDFMLANGDILNDLNPRELMELHKRSHAVMTTVVRKENIEIPYGILEMENGKFVDFLEKKSISYFRHVGIFAFNKDIFRHLEGSKGKRIEFFVKDLMDKGLADFLIYDKELLWLNINTPEELDHASEVFRQLHSP